MKITIDTQCITAALLDFNARKVVNAASGGCSWLGGAVSGIAGRHKERKLMKQRIAEDNRMLALIKLDAEIPSDMVTEPPVDAETAR